MADERRPAGEQSPRSDPRRKRAGALAALLAGTWLLETAAMIFGGRKDKKDKK